MASGDDLEDFFGLGLNSDRGRDNPEKTDGLDVKDSVRKLQDDLKVHHNRIEDQQAALEQLSITVADLAMQVGSLVKEMKRKNSDDSDKNKLGPSNKDKTCDKISVSTDDRRKSDVEILAEVLSRQHSNSS